MGVEGGGASGVFVDGLFSEFSFFKKKEVF